MPERDVSERDGRELSLELPRLCERVEQHRGVDRLPGVQRRVVLGARRDVRELQRRMVCGGECEHVQDVSGSDVPEPGDDWRLRELPAVRQRAVLERIRSDLGRDVSAVRRRDVFVWRQQQLLGVPSGNVLVCGGYLQAVSDEFHECARLGTDGVPVLPRICEHSDGERGHWIHVQCVWGGDVQQRGGRIGVYRLPGRDLFNGGGRRECEHLPGVWRWEL